MQQQEELNVQTLIHEYQEKLSSYVFETIKLKTLLKQSQEQNQVLLNEVAGMRASTPPMEVYDGEKIQE